MKFQLTNDITYRVRVRAVNASGSSAWVFASGMPGLPTVTLSVFPTTVAEGSTVLVSATLSAHPAAAVTIPITVTLDSAEEDDFALYDQQIPKGNEISTVVEAVDSVENLSLKRPRHSRKFSAIPRPCAGWRRGGNAGRR